MGIVMWLSWLHLGQRRTGLPPSWSTILAAGRFLRPKYCIPTMFRHIRLTICRGICASPCQKRMWTSSARVVVRSMAPYTKNLSWYIHRAPFTPAALRLPLSTPDSELRVICRSWFDVPDDAVIVFDCGPLISRRKVSRVQQGPVIRC